MTAVKWSIAVLFGLGSVGSLAMALTVDGISRTPVVRTAPPLTLRQFPTSYSVHLIEFGEFTFGLAICLTTSFRVVRKMGFIPGRT